MWNKRFKNRVDAGCALADRLAGLKLERPLILALARGGVPVAAEVARRFESPLDVVLVRKLGAPHLKELAIGAIINGDGFELILNRDVVDELGVSQSYIDAEVARQLAVIEKRRRLYMAGHDSQPVRGRVVILVDDGMATGASMAAAVKAVRKQDPARIIAAVPVASDVAVRLIAKEADQLVCIAVPVVFGAVGAHYRDFRQICDDDVVAVLALARSGDGGPEGRR